MTTKKTDQAYVYLVHASCGEYSGRMEWIVAAYLDEAFAKRHVELATTENKRIRAFLDSPQGEDYKYSNSQPKNVFDPDKPAHYVGADPDYVMQKVRVSIFLPSSNRC